VFLAQLAQLESIRVKHPSPIASTVPLERLLEFPVLLHVSIAILDVTKKKTDRQIVTPASWESSPLQEVHFVPSVLLGITTTTATLQQCANDVHRARTQQSTMRVRIQLLVPAHTPT
jgi:hypothetical protein